MDNSSETDKQALPEQIPQASLFWVIVLVVFSLSYLTLSLWILVDLWVREKQFICYLLAINKENLNNDVMFVMALYTVTGALLGNAVLDLVSYHKYWAIKRDFQSSHILGYFYGPWLAGTIGLIIFCLLQSGLFVFSGGAAQNIKIDETAISKMGYISVGFLSGFGWMSAVEKIREVVSRFFAKDTRESVESRKPTATEATESINTSASAQSPPSNDS